MENKSFRPHDRRKIKRPPSTSAQEATSILARHPRANFSLPSWRKRCNYRARFFPRFWPCHARVLVLLPPLLLLLPLLHLSLSRVWTRKASRLKIQRVVAGAPNFRVRSLSRRRRSGERGKRNEAKGWLCSSCKRGGG